MDRQLVEKEKQVAAEGNDFMKDYSDEEKEKPVETVGRYFTIHYSDEEEAIAFEKLVARVITFLVVFILAAVIGFGFLCS